MKTRKLVNLQISAQRLALYGYDIILKNYKKVMQSVFILQRLALYDI